MIGKRLLRVLKRLHAVDADFPLGAAMVFVAVAERHPEVVRALDVLGGLGLSQSARQRNVAVLTELSHTKKPGFDLMRSEMDRSDMRHRLLSLTPAGADLWAAVQADLSGGPRGNLSAAETRATAD